MDPVILGLAYAIRDTRHIEDEQDRAYYFYNHLINAGLVIVPKDEQDAMYRQGRKDEREFPSDLEF